MPENHKSTGAGAKEGSARVHAEEVDSADKAGLTSIWGKPVHLSHTDSRRLIHLQFRRYAGSPICSAHLCTFARRREEIWRREIEEIIVFHSSAEDLRARHGDLPFAVVADPARLLYREFAIGSSFRAMFHPRSVLGAVRGSIATRCPRWGVHRSGRRSLPADFLIDGNGRVLVSKQGEHADDQWSVDELLALAAEHREETEHA
jgi:peroxiredoxin